MPHRLHALSLLILAACFAAPAAAQETSAQSPDLKKLSIEELSEIEVTSVSRRAERLSHTAAAISVVRHEDVHRSGVTRLAEALRLADAVDVAQLTASSWGISVRGFNISSANKLLVLIDGRSTYSPLFGGTFWDVQDMLLADLDRIEVIRGPGGTIWGVNAVNGVVNVISRPAAETQGSTASLIGGSNDHAIASARHGGRAGNGYYRVYGKFRHEGPQLLASGGSAGDDISFGQGGFRLESNPAARTRWFLSGAAYRGDVGFSDRDDGTTSGGHVLGQMSRRTRLNGEFRLQAYYDRANRTVPLQFEGQRDTGEIDLQQMFRTGRHQLVFGSTFRLSDVRDRGTAGFVFDPEDRTSWATNVFVQDEFELLPDRVFLIAGTKIGRNNFTGLEFQPNARVRVHTSDRQMAWGAVSRAVRMPTRFDSDLRFLDPGTSQVVLTGTEDFDTETVIAYEGGYRIRPHARVAVDVAAFVNRYDDLRSQEMGPSGIVLGNFLNARTQGLEVATTFQPLSRWRLHGSYAWFGKSLSFDPGSTDPFGGAAEGNDPSHLASVHSWVDLPRRVTVDTLFRFVSARPEPHVDAYAELDARVGWSARPGWELSVVGQNLLNASHQELASGGVAQEFRRAVFLRSIWRF